jgi:hypothetical protein
MAVAAKLTNNLRGASRLFLGDGDSHEQKEDKARPTGTTSGISPAIQKRPSIIRSKASFQEKMTGSLKLGKARFSPAASMLSLPK